MTMGRVVLLSFIFSLSLSARGKNEEIKTEKKSYEVSDSTGAIDDFVFSLNIVNINS